MLRHKDVISLLSRVPEFPSPSYELEQYKTSASVAADVVFAAATSFDDIRGRLVLDLGCGTGVLGIAAAALGAAFVVGVDVDAGALSVAQGAAEETGVSERAAFLLADVLAAGTTMSPLRVRAGERAPASARTAPTVLDGDGDGALAADSSLSPSGDADGGGSGSTGSSAAFAAALSRGDGGAFDTCVMNPPFGTRRAGADVMFLRAALLLVNAARGVVYSLHKSSTRAHFARLAVAWGVRLDVVAELRFPVPATYAFHRDAERDIAVDLLRFERGAKPRHDVPVWSPTSASSGGGADRARGSRKR
jgi:predicted RNA methylase